MIDRRTLGAALLAAPALLKATPGLAQTANAAPAQAPGFYRFKLGSFTVTTLHDGYRTMPVANFVRNAPLPDVQAVLAESFLPADTYYNIYTATMVDTGRAVVLFDTGVGQGAPPMAGKLHSNMIASGIDPTRVTHVVLSHFHGDHIGGLLDLAGAKAFPNAEVLMPEAEWAWWGDAGNETRSPEGQRPNFANAARRLAPYQGQIRRFAAGREVLPGVHSIAAYGHTPGHTLFRIADGAEQLVYLADTTHRPELIARRPGYHTIFDFDATAAEATRRRVLDMVATDRVRVTGFHFPFPAAGHMLKDAQGYRFVPMDWASGA